MRIDKLITKGKYFDLLLNSSNSLWKCTAKISLDNLFVDIGALTLWAQDPNTNSPD